MKIEKFKVLLYLKKSGMDKNGKAPIMGRITVNRTMAQFSCKLSCTPSLWNPRAIKVGPGSQIYEWRQSLEKLGKADPVKKAMSNGSFAGPYPLCQSA